MLYGFTGTMVALINSFSASQPQLIGMASLLGVAFLMASLGAVAAGPNRRSEGDLIFSWAVVSSVFTVFGTLKLFSCTAIPFGLAILSIAALMFLWHRQGRVGPSGCLESSDPRSTLANRNPDNRHYGPRLYCASLRDNSGFSMQGQTRR